MNWHVTGRALFVCAALALSATFWVVAWGYARDAGYASAPQLTGWEFFSDFWASFRANPRGTELITVGWVIIAPVATILAAISAIGGPPSRSFSIIGGAAFIAAAAFIGFVFDASDGGITQGVFATMGLAVFLIILGCTVPRTAPKPRSH